MSEATKARCIELQEMTNYAYFRARVEASMLDVNSSYEDVEGVRELQRFAARWSLLTLNILCD